MQQRPALPNQERALLIRAVRWEPVKLAISILPSHYNLKHFCSLGYAAGVLAADWMQQRWTEASANRRGPQRVGQKSKWGKESPKADGLLVERKQRSAVKTELLPCSALTYTFLPPTCCLLLSLWLWSEISSSCGWDAIEWVDVSGRREQKKWIIFVNFCSTPFLGYLTHTHPWSHQ